MKIWQLIFWSIAKWFLADKVGNYLKSKWFINFLVNMWWDIVVSWLNAKNELWNIWISNPNDVDDIIYNVSLTNKSISTSWIYLRNWQINNKSFHHIRNPFSNKQSTKLKSVSIIDFHWYKTDALATAVIAMWYEEALKFCSENKISYIFILDDLSIVKSNDL